MYQQVTLVGNLGRDPEMRYTPSGVPVSSFSLAVNKSWTNNEGQRQDKTTWFRITCWRKQAEVVSQYLTKGRQVLVIGEINEPSTYTDREGNSRASLEVTANVVKFIGGRGDMMETMGEPGGSSSSNGDGGGSDFSDEDIPF